MPMRDLLTVIKLLVIARQQELVRRARHYFIISVCLSVCPSRCDIVSKRLHISSNFLDHLEFFLSPTALTKFQREPPQREQ